MRDSIDQMRNEPHYSQNYVELPHKKELLGHIEMIKTHKGNGLA